MYPNLKKQILSRLYRLRYYYERGYNKLVESYRDALPHTGKYDIFSGPFFERWLSENMTPEYIKYNIRPLIRDIAAMEKEANAYMFRRGKFKRENPEDEMTAEDLREEMGQGYVIAGKTHGGYDLSEYGKWIEDFADIDDAFQEIVRRMKKKPILSECFLCQ
jgi:hypothetical protein